MRILITLMLCITTFFLVSCNGEGTGGTSADSTNAGLTNVTQDTGMHNTKSNSTPSTDTIKTGAAASPVLVKLDGWFQTTTEDKDWDTQLGIRINKNGHVVAEKFCCSGAKDDDHYADGFKSPAIHVDVYTTDPTTKAGLDSAVLILSAQASQRGKGSDHWRFDYTMQATFSDGSTRNWTITQVDINSEHSMRTEKSYDLYKYHD